jgi:hypothetical protein
MTFETDACKPRSGGQKPRRHLRTDEMERECHYGSRQRVLRGAQDSTRSHGSKYRLRWGARLAAVGAFVIAGAFSLSVHAEELAQNLGPVGPREPILATVGNKRVIAFYTPDGGHCDAHVIVWDPADGEASSTIHVRVSLYPRQIVNVHTPEALGLQCGDNAEKLTIADSGEQLRAGPRSRP